MNGCDYYNFLDRLDKVYILFEYLVEKYGEIKVIPNSESDEGIFLNTVHDYIYFCFTKSTRSLMAVNILAKKGHRVDSLILLRTIYENYIRVAYVLKNPIAIIELVIQEVGLRTGDYKYLENDRGKKNLKKVIHVESGEISNHGTTLYQMAKNTINPLDLEIHRELYKYLCEHTHSSMNASGNYRFHNDTQYWVANTKVYLEVPFISSYLSILYCDVINTYHTNKKITVINEFEEHEKKMLQDLVTGSIEDINKMIEEMEIDVFKSEIMAKEHILARISINVS